MKKSIKFIACFILWACIGFSTICYDWTQNHGYDLTIREIPIFIFSVVCAGPAIIPFVLINSYNFSEIVLIKGKNSK